MAMELVRTLWDGPIDVIGDVHGEREALEILLDKLGYDHRGNHAGGRRIVFVGDLCDRGPDSPGTLRIARTLIEEHRALAVAGNHELNLLRREEKHGNHWFFGKGFDAEFGHCVALAASDQAQVLDFLRSLPIVLERADLRIVHAAWTDSAVARVRAVDEPLDAAYDLFDEALRRDPDFRALAARYEDELGRLDGALKDPSVAPAARALGLYDEACQIGNPVRVVTSGIERATRTPFFASGKWRFANRVAWWREYEGDVPVLFGHYWRTWDPAMHRVLSPGEPQLFADDTPGPYMADHHRAFCIDFSAGARYRQRMAGHEPPYHGRLAAIRWPERQLVFDTEPHPPA